MTPTFLRVPVLRIGLNFISHSNRDFIHIYILWDESWWFTSTFLSCVSQISQKELLNKNPKISTEFPSMSTKFPQHFPLPNYGSNFQFWDPDQGGHGCEGICRLDWEENPNGLIFAKEKTEAVEKMGSFFFWNVCIGEVWRVFFLYLFLGRGLLLRG